MYKKDKSLRITLRLSYSDISKLLTLSQSRNMNYSELIRYILHDYFIRFDVKEGVLKDGN